MSFKIEKIKPADIEKIMADADELRKKRLKMRGGHFVEGVDENWVIDRERDIYLLNGPAVESRSEFLHFYFHFESSFYEFKIYRNDRNRPAIFDVSPLPSDFSSFMKELKEAFFLYQDSLGMQWYSLSFDIAGEVKS